MSVGVLLGIGALGGFGALARFLVDVAVSGRASTSFPIGTLLVNLSGAFALGIVAGALSGGDSMRLVATGLLGSYTTFSTWAFESQRLGEDGELGLGALNFAISLVLGVTLAWAGTELGGLL